jgi:hypothetical protein
MKSIFLIVFAILFAQMCNCQTYFQKRFYTPEKNAAYDGLQSSDSGYVLAGKLAQTGQHMPDYCLIKTNQNGDTLWTKIYEGSGDDFAESVRQTFDGGYVVSGLYSSNQLQGFLLKTDSLGNVAWSKEYVNLIGQVQSQTAIQTSDSGYLLLTNRIDTLRTALLIKTDPSGNIEWARSCTTDSILVNHYTHGLIQSADGNYIFVGEGKQSQMPLATSRYIAVLKLDIYGNMIWTKSFSSGHPESIKPTSDGGCILTGGVYNPFTTKYDILTLTLDSTGNTLWSKRIGTATGDITGNDIITASSGGYYLIAKYFDLSVGDINLIIKLDSAGNVLFSQSYDPPVYSVLETIKETFDNNLVCFGYSTGFSGTSFSLDIIKTNATADSGCYFSQFPVTQDTLTFQPVTAIGVDSFPLIVNSKTTITNSGCDVTDICETVGVKENQQRKELNIYPNPTRGILHFNQSLTATMEVRIFSATGAVEIVTKINQIKDYLDVSRLSAGYHFAELISDDEISIIGFVKLSP